MLGNQCPLCGKPIEGESVVCADCLEDAQKRQSISVVFDEDDSEPKDKEQLSEKGSNPESDLEERTEKENLSVFSEVKKKRDSKKHLFFLSFVILICLALSAIIFITEKNARESQERELAFWYSCIEENTPFGYSKYLIVYPDGRFMQDARNKITELREKERIEWERLKMSSDIDDYRNFLKVYPTTPFRGEITKVMDSLSWVVAIKEDTSDSYKFYIENTNAGHISGFYKGIAEERYNYLSQIRELDQKELQNMKSRIEMLFKALSNADYKKLNELFDDTIINFYGARNYSSTAIVSTIKSDMDKNKIRSLVYKPDMNLIKVYKDGKNMMVAELNVTKRIIYKGKKTTENIDEILHVDITSDMKVRSLYPVK